MNDLSGKKIILGITGGIAAYKSAYLCRELVKNGAMVRVVMTPSATRFITPLTMQALSGHPVYSDLYEAESENAMGHIELARWADWILIAPASAQTLERLASGRADELLAATVLASSASLLIAPAMNHQMWRNPATQNNVRVLESRGALVLGPDEGDQACGEEGSGRMLEPESIVSRLMEILPAAELTGLKVMLTAGPTWEAIDPVRGLTNRSSGKMGYAIARQLVSAGAKVTLVSGPTSLLPPAGLEFRAVTSAGDMAEAVMKDVQDCDIFIAVAAVADYRPVAVSASKIKKSEEYLNIELVRNPDILTSVAALEPPPFTVGFAAETDNIVAYAEEKLAAKGINMIAANSVAGENSAFNSEENELTLIDSRGTTRLERTSKPLLALKLIKEIAERYYETHSAKNT
jgi:phosphopantothenoylcysteine decarboxylase/phosphopantothenate--cysteine ligase